MSKSGVNESLKQNFIKIVLTKNQKRSKRDKKWIRIRKSECVESDETYYYIGKFNTALSPCGVLRVTLYFSKGFLKVVATVL